MDKQANKKKKKVKKVKKKVTNMFLKVQLSPLTQLDSDKHSPVVANVLRAQAKGHVDKGLSQNKGITDLNNLYSTTPKPSP